MASTALDGGVGAVFEESREDDNRVKVPRPGCLSRFGGTVLASPYYTRVVEWGCGRVLLWPVEGKVLKAWRGCILVIVLGIMVMVLGVISGTSSGARRSASV